MVKPEKKASGEESMPQRLLAEVGKLLKSKIAVEACAFYVKDEQGDFGLTADHFFEGSTLDQKCIDLSDIELSFQELNQEKHSILLPYQLPAECSDTGEQQTKILIASPLFDAGELCGVLVFLTLLDDLTFGEEDRDFLKSLTALIQPVVKGGIDSPKEPAHQNNGSALEYTNQVLFCFDKICSIQPDYAVSLEKLFNRKVVGENALVVLFEWAEALNTDSASFNPHPESGMIEGLLETVFSRITDLDVILELLPNQIRFDGRVFAIQYKYLKNESPDKDVILAVLSDKTREIQLEQAIQREKDRNGMIVKVAMDVEGFYQFKNSTHQVFHFLTEELQKSPESIDLWQILHHLNVIEAGAEVYEMKEVAECAIQIETRILNLIRNDTATLENTQSVIEQVQELQEKIAFLNLNYLDSLVADSQILDNTLFKVSQNKINQLQETLVEDIFIPCFKEVDELIQKNMHPYTKSPQLAQLTLHRLDKIKSKIWDQLVPNYTKLAEKVLDEIKMQPIGMTLNKYAVVAESLAKKLGKQVEVHIQGAQTEVPSQRLEELLGSLVHVIRNSVEHGLESMEERVFLGKPLEGRIDIEAEIDDENRLKIKIQDDGKGIDVQKIKEKAVETELLLPEEAGNISDEEVLDLIPALGYTGKRDQSEKSIKGVGLNSVMNSVQSLDGELSIQTEIEKGTTTQIIIPLGNF